VPACVPAAELCRGFYREAALGATYEALARRHALLPGAGALDPAVRPFRGRPALHRLEPLHRTPRR
jgi:hypothetical protein